MSQAEKIMKLIDHARVTPGQHIAFIGVTLGRVRRTIWSVILDAHGRNWIDKQIRNVDTMAMRINFSNGSTAQCYGANRPDMLRGQRFTAVCIEEQASGDEARLMMMLAGIMTPPERPEAPLKPVFGL